MRCCLSHACHLAGEELFCATETICVEQGKEYVDLRAEERFTRRNHCMRSQTRPEAQGFPVTCK